MAGTSTGPWSDLATAPAPSTAAAMVHSKLTTESGHAAASAAAQQAKIKLQMKNQIELLEAALTPPQQRTQSQIERLCDFLSTVHLLKSLQPTALKSLAHAMVSQSQAAGSIIYKQGESARHLYVVLTGEVVMYEQDAQQQEQEASPRGADSFSRAGRSSMPKASSPRGMRVILSPGGAGRTKPQSPRLRSPSPSTSKPLSPRRMGSSTWQHVGSSTAGAACSPRGGDSAGAQGPNHSEVRRVRTREAFGEDEVTAHTRREQTAVSIGANKQTFSSSSSSSDGRGPSGGGGSQGSTGGAVLSPAAAAGPQETVAAAVPASAAVVNPGLVATASQQLRVQQPGAAAAAAVADPRSQCVLLVLSAEDYGAALKGRLTGLLEEKVAFLAGLPAMKGLSMLYLRVLSHCFHQVNFEPREVVVHQGDVSDCMYVLKSGQVCILIDPSQTLAEQNASDSSSSDGSKPAAAQRAATSSNGGTAAEPTTASDLDTKKLVQVCMLGSGAIIGDMSVRESAGGPPRRTATVVALTELVTYKVPLKEFKRRMPADVLEAMRQVANQKLEMNDTKAQERALANGRDGQVLLGGLALPECVLQGKGLRALLEAQQQAAPVSGLIQALEMCVGADSACKGKTGGSGAGSGCGSPRQPTGKQWMAGSSRKAQEVEGFVASLSRNGFLTAPPDEFLALMTDWRSARTNSHAEPQKIPPGWLFPLALPGQKRAQAGQTNAAALTSANSHLHPAQGSMASLTHAASRGAVAAGPANTWSDPAVTTVVVPRPLTPQQQEAQAGSLTAQPSAGSEGPGSTMGAGLSSQHLLSSPTSLLAAMSLDQYVQSPLGSPSSRHTSRPTTPSAAAGAGSSSNRGLHAAAVARDATQQLLGGQSPRSMCRAAGGMGGRGTLLRGPLPQPGTLVTAEAATKLNMLSAAADCKATATKTPFAAATALHRDTEPTAEEATIKASTLFRPGSPVCIGRCGSPKPPTHSSDRVAAAASHAGATVLPQPVLEGLSPGVPGAVISRAGKQELTFHTASGPGTALQLQQ